MASRLSRRQSERLKTSACAFLLELGDCGCGTGSQNRSLVTSLAVARASDITAEVPSSVDGGLCRGFGCDTNWPGVPTPDFQWIIADNPESRVLQPTHEITPFFIQNRYYQ